MRLLLLSVACLVRIIVHSQNLISNGDFELINNQNIYKDTIEAQLESKYINTIVPFIHLNDWEQIFKGGEAHYFCDQQNNLRYASSDLFAHLCKIHARFSPFRNHSCVITSPSRIWLDSTKNPVGITSGGWYMKNGTVDDWCLSQELAKPLIKDSWYTLSYRHKLGIDRDKDVCTPTFHTSNNPATDSPYQDTDTIYYRHILQRMGVLFTTYNLIDTSFFFQKYRKYLDTFHGVIYDTVLDSSYRWRLVEYRFKADSNYSHIYLAPFKRLDEALFKLESGFVSNSRKELRFLDIFSSLDDIRLLPFDKYLKITNDTMVCPNSTVTMRILSGKGGIKWRSASNPNLILSQGDSLITVCPDTPTRYEAISPYDTASIMVYPIKKTKASFSVILDGLTANFINTSSNATSFQWDFGVNRSFDSNKNSKFKYWQPGPYYVRLIANNAKCLSDTFFKTIYVTGLSIIPLQNLNYQPYIYPNPFSNQINIDLNKTYQKIDFQVYETTGRILKQYIYKNQTSCVLRPDDLPKGTYYLKIKTEEKSYVYKLQKE